MPTTALVLLAVFVAIIGVVTLTLLHRREQKKLEQARNIVTHSDTISAMHTIGVEMEPWLSIPMMNFLGATIIRHKKALAAMQVSETKRVRSASESANQWAALQKKINISLPGSPEQAQQIRNNVKILLNFVREAYQNKELALNETKALLGEAKDINIKLTLAVFQERYASAAKLNNHYQALHYLKRIKEVMHKQPNLTPDQQQFLTQINEKMAYHEEMRKNETKNRNSRLEEGAQELSQEEEAWKKKRYDLD